MFKGDYKSISHIKLNDAYGILQLSKDQSTNKEAVRAAYTNKMRVSTQNRRKRIELNAAYLQIMRSLFKVVDPQQKFLNMVMCGETERVIGKIRQNKSLLNYRTAGAGYPIIYEAVRSGNYDIVEFFLKSGCSLQFKNDKSTPMHCAAYYGHYTLIPLLLKYGVPLDIKNCYGYLPYKEACTPEIKRLLTDAHKDNIYQLQNQLNKEKLSLGVIDIKENGKTVIRKILLTKIAKNFYNYTDAFHGTSFHCLASIAKHGLRPPGRKVGDQLIVPVAGHIRRGVSVNKINDWADAIFVSPSIYYAAHPVYAKVMVNNNNERWLPIVQTKVKEGTFTRWDHTFGNDKYQVLQDEPNTLEYRVEVKNEDHQQLIFRSEYSDDHKEEIQVVALILIREGYLDQHNNYYETTNLLLDSAEQRAFRKQH